MNNFPLSSTQTDRFENITSSPVQVITASMTTEDFT